MDPRCGLDPDRRDYVDAVVLSADGTVADDPTPVPLHHTRRRLGDRGLLGDGRRRSRVRHGGGHPRGPSLSHNLLGAVFGFGPQSPDRWINSTHGPTAITA